MALENPSVSSAAASGSAAECVGDGSWIPHPSRDRTLQLLTHQVKKLASGTLRGTGHCFVVVGPRGTGKSTMLRRLISDTPDTVRVVTEADLKGHKYLAAAVLAKFHDTDGVCAVPARLAVSLNNALRERAGGLLIVLDECETLYTDRFTEDEHSSNMQFLEDVSNLQGRRRLMYVLSGSAPRLRPLVFAKITKEECPPRYSRYNAAYDLNSGKTRPLLVDTREWTQEGFCAAIRALLGDGSLQLSSDQARVLYLSLGGELRELEFAISECGSVGDLLELARFEAVRNIRDPAHGLLRIVRFVMEGMTEKRLLSSLSLTAWVRDPFSFRRDVDGWIDDDHVLGKPVPGGDTVLTKADLYNLSDDGFLFYDDATLRVMVPCVHALLRFDALREGGIISFMHQLVLTYPFGPFGIDAESILGVCLNEKKGGPPPESEFALRRLEYKDAWTTDELLEHLAGHTAAVLKEHPDTRGADLVLLEEEPDDQGRERVRMTRVQVKLTSPRTRTGNWDASNITEVLKRFGDHPVTVDGVAVRTVLATTHVLTEGAQRRCNEKGIEIWDRNHLTKNAWREEIVRWGRENGYEEYAPSSTAAVAEELRTRANLAQSCTCR